jgi:DNA polymerase-3 subunit beta
MKITCSKENLVKGVNIVSKAVPVRTTMPILECILVDASTTEIKLMANDMEIGIETIVEGTIEERGIIAIDAKFFGELVRKLPDSDVTITTDEKYNAKIQCESVIVETPCKPGDDFSYIPNVERFNPVVISQFSLKEVIRQTIFSIAENDNNKLMTGELFEIKGNKLKVVSLDGHRISIRNIELKDEY